MQSITLDNGHTWKDLGNSYFGLVVEPGGPDDTSSGKVGLKVFYPQYDPPSALLDELRKEVLPRLRAIREANEKAEIAARIAALSFQRPATDTRLCLKCGTYCYGDCEAI